MIVLLIITKLSEGTFSHVVALMKVTAYELSAIYVDIYIFVAIALEESIFLDVLHFPVRIIMSRDLEVTPMGGATSKPSSRSRTRGLIFFTTDLQTVNYYSTIHC